jgi:Concanavalin A-like lectin/glucanases superfamily
MGRAFTQAAANTLSRTSNPPATAVPLTISAWFKVGPSLTGFIFMLQDSVGGSAFGFSAAQNPAKYEAYCWITGTQNSFDSIANGIPMQADVWHHVAVVYSSATVRAMIIDGLTGSKVNGNGVSITPTGIACVTMGGLRSSSAITQLCDASIADCAVWDVALTDAEVVALSKGVPPTLIRPSDLTGFWPLEAGSGYLQSRIRDGASYTLTLTGTAPTAADHPPTQTPFLFQNKPGYPALLPYNYSEVRPSADSADGNWVNESASNVNLFASIDETVADDDTTYIRSGTNPTADVCKVKLGSPAGGITTPMRIRYRFRKNINGAPIDLQVRLLEGTTSVWSITHTNLGSDFFTYDENITPSPAIVDATNLFLEFSASKE